MCYPLQIAQLDEVKIRISALRSIVDLLLLYGFQLLSDRAATRAAPAASGSPGSQEEEEVGEGDGPAEEKGDAAEDTAQSILAMLSEFLDGEVCSRWILLRCVWSNGLRIRVSFC